MSRPKKSSPNRPGRLGDFFGWLIVLAFLGALGWFWWQEKHPAVRQKISVPTRTVEPVKAEPKVPAKPAPVAPPVPLEKLPSLVKPVAPLVPASAPTNFPRPARDVFEAQVGLASRAISPGSIDGAMGSQTRAAITAFQRAQNLAPTSSLDTNTSVHLTLNAPVLTTYVVTSNDLAGLQPVGKTWLEKSEQSSLAYETELELVAERGHANPALVRQLNPNVSWNNVVAGTLLKIPDVNYPDPEGKAAFIIIHLAERFLEAFDEKTNLLVHFPCSIAAKVEKRPVGELKVIVIAPNPNYTVNPELFPESSELQAIGHKLILPPGPNNPVGVAWIGLDKPGYGMHGTPVPELVGRTESHGCFRLANWDAEYLIKLVWIGMPVRVEP